MFSHHVLPSRRLRVALAASAIAALAGIAAFAVSAIANNRPSPENWGVITRNSIGSGVADLRTGPYGSFGVTGAASRPPYGRGSLGIQVSNAPGFTEKVDYGNEVDFYGDPVLGLTAVGFQVFQTGENAAISPSNMPNIRMEIDPNLSTSTSNYSTLVWVPDPAPVTNQWSGYLDATTTGKWYLTGNAGTVSGCNQTTMCTFAQLKAALNDGGDAPTIYTVAVGKGRDYAWVGAVDGLRINAQIFDFEADGVRVLRAPADNSPHD